MSNLKFSEGYSLEEIFEKINELPKNLECFKRLGRISEGYKTEYKLAFEHFVEVNSRENLNGVNKKDDNRIKGKVLEDLVSLLFESTGDYYEVHRNVRNGSNEIDLFLVFSDKGHRLSQLLNKKYSRLLCECKNYNSSVDVTYVGKFCSLMQTTNNNLGIMFSYLGFSGKSWGGSKGLTKKIYLLKERVEEKLYILEFKKEDFAEILNGKSIFEILDNKCQELELGTDDITKYITEHPNERKTEV